MCEASAFGAPLYWYPHLTVVVHHKHNVFDYIKLHCVRKLSVGHYEQYIFRQTTLRGGMQPWASLSLFRIEGHMHADI